MGAICLCGGSKENEIAALTHLSLEERANVGGDKIKKQGYTGPLQTMNSIMLAEDGSGNLIFPPSGPYCHFSSESRIDQVSENQEQPAAVVSNGTIVLDRNLKIDLGLYIVDSIFINENVLLRVRLFIEP